MYLERRTAPSVEGGQRAGEHSRSDGPRALRRRSGSKKRQSSLCRGGRQAHCVDLAWGQALDKEHLSPRRVGRGPGRGDGRLGGRRRRGALAAGDGTRWSGGAPGRRRRMPAQTGVPSVLTRCEHRPENILVVTSPKTGMWCKQRENGGMVPISQHVHRSFRGVRSGSVGYIVTAAGRNRSRGLGSPMTGRSPSLERVLGSPDRTFW